jgi:glycine/D-amino acid oxidase-like deaminating enzyme/nitrite reductase/ring-hydroxylating ferredoxin subunit
MTDTLPGKAESCWTDKAPRTRFPKLQGNATADVVVVGAGIVGLTAALALARAGVSVVVLEAMQVGRQVTGRSTAKVTTQHALIYKHLIDTYSLERAKLYAEANVAGVSQIRDWVREYDIDCDFESKAAYAYASRAQRRGAVEAEAEAARQVGLDAQVLRKAPLPFDTEATLCFPDQAQFNPTRYLLGIAAAARGAGARIYENGRVSSFHQRNRWQVMVGARRVEAERLVMATNLPIDKPGRFDLWTQPRCHIAMAFRMAERDAIDGMFIGIDAPTHSLRMGRDSKGPLLVALGPKFPTGHDGDVARRFRDLEDWVRKNLPVGKTKWRWANEDYDTPDRVPFVGAAAKTYPGYYVATGFNAWGISNGTAAGLLIADLARDLENPWTQLYDPQRKAAKNINKGGETQSRVKSADEIAKGEGGVIYRGKNPIAVYRPEKGRPIARSAACTHLGCTITWNNAEKNWNCPCHGSMFSAEGEVIHGPAVEKLRPAQLPPARKDTKKRR